MKNLVHQALGRLFTIVLILAGLTTHLIKSGQFNDAQALIVMLLVIDACALTSLMLLHWVEYAESKDTLLPLDVQVLSIVLVVLHIALLPFSLKLGFTNEAGWWMIFILAQYIGLIVLFMDVVLDLIALFIKYRSDL